MSNLKINNKECDCCIGEISMSLMHKSTYIDDILGYSICSKVWNKPRTINEILDEDEGIITRYHICPNCGKSIDWAKLIKLIKRENRKYIKEQKQFNRE